MCGFERVVDVGGGHGELLTAVLHACPRTRGVLFDRPDADMQMLAILGSRERSTDEYRALMAEAGFNLTKVTPLGGRFSYAVFEGVPQKS